MEREKIEKYFGKKAVVTFKSVKHNGSFAQTGRITGFLEANPNYLGMDFTDPEATSTYPGGIAPGILIARIEKIALL